MDRRKFIKTGALAITASLLPYQKIFALINTSKVFEISGEPEKSISLLFSTLGGIKSLINKEISKSTVLIKPNICLPNNDSNATTTSSQLIKALCEYFITEGVGRVIIADHTLQSAEQFETIDLVKYARSNPKITLLLANEQRHYVPRQIDGEVLKNTEILKILEKTDYFINVPTAKHHQATSVSLSIKNLMGVIWDRQIFHTGLDLHQAIADLAKAVRPNLNIVDASRVLLNRGPVGPGPIEKGNRIYASTDMVALDSVVVSKYNFGGKSCTADEITHLWASYKGGVGEINIDKITLEKMIA
jgi:uncharacterized protein (DUF362 family)